MPDFVSNEEYFFLLYSDATCLKRKNVTVFKHLKDYSAIRLHLSGVCVCVCVCVCSFQVHLQVSTLTVHMSSLVRKIWLLGETNN
jgi:hypothetical protein